MLNHQEEGNVESLPNRLRRDSSTACGHLFAPGDGGGCLVVFEPLGSRLSGTAQGCCAQKGRTEHTFFPGRKARVEKSSGSGPRLVARCGNNPELMAELKRLY